MCHIDARQHEFLLVRSWSSRVGTSQRTPLL